MHETLSLALSRLDRRKYSKVEEQQTTSPTLEIGTLHAISECTCYGTLCSCSSICIPTVPFILSSTACIEHKGRIQDNNQTTSCTVLLTHVNVTPCCCSLGLMSSLTLLCSCCVSSAWCIWSLSYSNRVEGELCWIEQEMEREWTLDVDK